MQHAKENWFKARRETSRCFVPRKTFVPARLSPRKMHPKTLSTGCFFPLVPRSPSTGKMKRIYKFQSCRIRSRERNKSREQVAWLITARRLFFILSFFLLVKHFLANSPPIKIYWLRQWIIHVTPPANSLSIFQVIKPQLMRTFNNTLVFITAVFLYICISLDEWKLILFGFSSKINIKTIGREIVNTWLIKIR